ncbi:phosphatidate cytidylyltransferase [Enterococcus phage PEF1]
MSLDVTEGAIVLWVTGRSYGNIGVTISKS